MKIKFIGHSCFLITTGDGTRILTDPYEAGCYDGAMKYRSIEDPADIVLVSHDHPDHSASSEVPGEPRVVDHPGQTSFGDIEVLGVPVWHDTSGGAERGSNIVFRVRVDGLTICHLGDIGHSLDRATAGKILPVDVLLVPVGGYFTADKKAVDDLISVLGPRLVIPMHFKTAGCDFPIASVEDFLEGGKEVTRPGSSQISLTPGGIPQGILVLEPANLP